MKSAIYYSWRRANWTRPKGNRYEQNQTWVIILLSLAVLVMIGINLADKEDTAQVVVNNNEPTYKSEHTDTVVYSPEGALSYHLIAQHVEYYSEQAVSWFTQPVLTTFDKDKYRPGRSRPIKPN